MTELTITQSNVLEFIRCYSIDFCRLPSSRQIAQHFGWRSNTAAMWMLRSLVKKGYLEHVQPDYGRAFYRFPRP